MTSDMTKVCRSLDDCSLEHCLQPYLTQNTAIANVMPSLLFDIITIIPKIITIISKQ